MPEPKPADPIEVFRTLCWARAELWRGGEWEWIGHAVDPLQEWAVANGLVRLIGQDAVQQIMAEAFGERSHA